jgi:hypothetical protein
VPVSRETHAKRYADILAMKDVQAWLLKQRMANWRYCSVCKGRVVRKKNATIECRKCGRWMTVADYEASITPAPEPQPVEDVTIASQWVEP